jgi:hypothetical protein
VIRPNLALLLALAAGCAGGRTTAPAPVTQSFPGFDTGIYPGDSAMSAWRRPHSPYHWVGYYLPAPCRRDTSWAGKRQTLSTMGWGLAVLYVGQQTWEGVPERAPAPPDTARAGGDTLRAQAPQRIICSRTLLTAAQGRSEADDAITRAEAEGFARGTHVFLDIERMTTIPQSMRDYYRAWVTRVLGDGRYRPAIYAHQRNAAEIYADVRAIFDSAGVRDEPSFWISSPTAGEFALSSLPRNVGFAFARVWQGAIDVRQSWNDVRLRIDANVADSPSPSAARPAVPTAAVQDTAPARSP